MVRNFWIYSYDNYLLVCVESIGIKNDDLWCELVDMAHNNGIDVVDGTMFRAEDIVELRNMLVIAGWVESYIPFGP